MIPKDQGRSLSVFAHDVLCVYCGEGLVVPIFNGRFLSVFAHGVLGVHCGEG